MMILRVVLLLICGAKFILQDKLTLSPTFPIALENTSLELTCNAPVGTTRTQWGTINRKDIISYLTVSKDGPCETVGFLIDTKYFETECNSNGTFKVRIKQVNLSHHGQAWYCHNNPSRSNTVNISVQVPVKYVELRNVYGNVLNVIENIDAPLTCLTSEGRPTANITWTTISQTDIEINMTHNVTYNVSTTEILSKKNLTTVKSSIQLVPKREDNNSLIICRAKNGNFTSVENNATLYVQYPPNKPMIFVNERQTNGDVHLMFGSNASFFCKSDSYPGPTYHWNSTGISKYSGQYLNMSNLNENETWQCTSANSMTLYDKPIFGSSSANINVYLYYSRQILMFYVNGKESGESFEAIENETIIFNCSVRIIPKPEIIIYFAETELWRNKYANTISESLEITSCLDDGVYTCEARDKYKSQPFSTELRLFVKCTPLLSPDFDLTMNVTCPQSETITLQFKALAYPTPQFSWLKLTGYTWKSLNSSTKYGIHTADKHSNLTIRDITENDYGIYKLRIQNDIGSLEQLFFLKPNDIPSLTEKPLMDWMYITYTCGGFTLLLSVLIITMCSRKRLLTQQSTARTVYQNVPFGVPETDSTSHNLQLLTQTAAIDQHVLPTRKPKACRSKIRRHQNRISVPPQQLELDLELDIEEPYTEASVYCNAMEIIKQLDKIKVAELYEYVRGRTDESFNADFQKIPIGFQMPCCYARRPENIALNRFKGILPYDHTRVRVDEQPDFFINASYIDGYNGPKTYIACLGPTAATHDNFKTFWKMVWCERSELIIMVTNLNEASGMKCEQYWPDANQDEMYGDILVSCQKIEIFAEYTIRSFEVTRSTEEGKVCRNLIHLHYTAWPDKRTPEDVTSLLEFGQTFHDIRTTVSGPLIVHCSAGIGRTGVFIAIDRLIMEGKNEGSVNVVACITKMREQRVRMVQTSEQYKFIFQVLAYALNFDCKPIQIEKLTHQFESEMSDDRLFEKQYKELNLALEEESKEQTDCREKNRSYKDKNRQGADIPDNTNRVYLYQNRSYEDSDYINAVFINSYTCKDHFIMAQSPLPGTESDFLTLIYQENCFCVISMDDYNDLGMKIGKYLFKENHSLDIGNFTVSCFLTDSKEQYIVRKVTIKNNDEFSKGERYFYHFQYKTWIAENDIPLNVEEFVDFVKDVQEYAKLGDDSSHVLAHCLNASERSGLFCAIAIIREKLLFDEQVSILNTSRHIRTRRPSAITSLDQLKFCYKAAVAIADKQHERIYINDPNMI